MQHTHYVAQCIFCDSTYVNIDDKQYLYNRGVFAWLRQKRICHALIPLPHNICHQFKYYLGCQKVFHKWIFDFLLFCYFIYIFYNFPTSRENVPFLLFSRFYIPLFIIFAYVQKYNMNILRTRGGEKECDQNVELRKAIFI